MYFKDDTFYIFTETNDYSYTQKVLPSVKIARSQTNNWLSIQDGKITIYGTNRTGYSWDGCSPKFSFLNIVLGTPDGVVDTKTGKRKTYYASMVHDILYQFRDLLRPLVKRKHVDRLFLQQLQEGDYLWAWVYYLGVRSFGWLYWNDLLKKRAWLIYVFLIPPGLILGGLMWFLIRCFI